MEYIIIVCIVLVLVGAGCYMYSTYNRSSKEVFSFRTAMELLELPVITLYVEEKKLHFLLDTGSDKSIINSKVLEHIPYNDTGETCRVYGLDGIIKQSQHGITLHGLLGTEFFNKYKYVIDFEKLIAYHKKK